MPTISNEVDNHKERAMTDDDFKKMKQKSKES